MHLNAEITGIKYKPFLIKVLPIYNESQLEIALQNNSSFILDFGSNQQMAVSWWVSSKRTRSYPYSRVYSTLNFQGKRVTVIPIYKDEGFDGDRDFLQWDTISLMSLLGVYTVIGYYKNAKKNDKYVNKITGQRFDVDYIKAQIKTLLAYQSDALHWNITQIEKVATLAQKALDSYTSISKELNIKMHSSDSAKARIEELIKGKKSFMELSRKLAKQAQKREGVTTQPKENVSGSKANITIKNYLGGYYFFTSDEMEFDGNLITLYECKHSKNAMLPSIDDIKDGLIKMVLFSNLKNVMLEGKVYPHKSVLKLTSEGKIDKQLNSKQKDLINLLRNEASTNGFRVDIL